MSITSKLEFRPKLWSALKHYDSAKLQADLTAGVVVGIVALPLAIAFAIASGVSPTVGLMTAILGGFMVSAFGGNSVQIGGPTGAFIVIVYGIIARFGLEGLALATLMAGLILVLMGLFRLGTVIKFIPYPIVIGFTAGIALTIFSTQVNDFLGLGLKDIPSEFIPKWGVYLANLGNVDWLTLAIGLVTLAIIILTPKVSKRLPGALVAIILVTAAVYLLGLYGIGGDVATIGGRFGELKAELPRLQTFSFDMETINMLLPSAFTIAMLGAIESLLSATVADGVTGSRTNTNTELIGQGLANIAVPFIGGIPVTGAIARTMTNINNGGRTPVAGIIHAVVLLLILLFLMPLAKYIPMACLAGVLVVVSYNMSGWRTFKNLFKNPKSDVAVLLLTFFLTVIFDLTVAIEVGLVIACILFIKRVMETTQISVIKDELNPQEESDMVVHEEKLNIPQGVEVYEINGPYFFGIATRFEETMNQIGDRPKIRIIRMRRVPFIDSSGLHNLESLCQLAQKAGIRIILSGVNGKVFSTLEKAGFVNVLGRENVCANINLALERSREVMSAMADEKA